MSLFFRNPVAIFQQWTLIASGALMAATAPSVALAEPAPEKASSATIESRSFVVRIQARDDDAGAKVPLTDQELARSIITIKQRLELLGFAEPRISKKDRDSLLIELHNLEPDDNTRVVTALQKAGRFGFREVSPRTDERGPDGKPLAQRVLEGDEIVPGYRALTLKGKDENGHEFKRAILVNRRMALGNQDIATAQPSPQQADAVSITLTVDGTAKMVALTENLHPGLDRIAIILDGEVISAPVVNQVPLGKNFIIEGFREPGEVQSLAVALTNPFEFSLIVEEHPAPAVQKDAK